MASKEENDIHGALLEAICRALFLSSTKGRGGKPGEVIERMSADQRKLLQKLTPDILAKFRHFPVT